MNLKGIIKRQVGDQLLTFRFTNLTQYLYLHLLRKEGLSEQLLTHFEVRVFLFLAALQAAEMPIATKEEVFDLMDEITEEEQIKIIEEGGEYLDFMGKLALDLRTQFEHTKEQARILRAGMEMMKEIVLTEQIEQETQERMQTLTNTMSS